MNNEMTHEEENEYESEDFLKDLSPDFKVKIISDEYTVKELEDKEFKVKYNPENDLIFIFAKRKFSWSEDELPYRSIVVDLDGNVVSAGFPKFFNYKESKCSEPIDEVFEHAIMNQDSDLVFTHKYDGTLIIRSVVNDEVMMRTRGTLSGREYGEAAKRIAASKYPQLLDIDYFPDMSLLFEYVGPENRIVISYDEADLILIGAIKHDNLEPLIWSELKQIDNAFKLAETYSLSDKSLEEINDFLIQYPELIEGLVIRIGDCFTKIKTEDYLRLHRLKSDVNYSKVADIVRENNIQSWEELKALLHELQWDEEWFNAVREHYNTYVEKQQLLRNIEELSPIVVKKIKDNSIVDDRDRKANFAKKISDAPVSVKPFLFGAYDGKLDQVINRKEFELEYLKEVVEYLQSLM